MFRRILSAGSALAAMLVACAAGPAAAVTALSGSVDAAAQVTMGHSYEFGDVLDHHTSTAAGLPSAPLSATALAQIDHLGDTVRAHASNDAFWQSASQGELDFNDNWSLQMNQLSNGNETAQFSPHPPHTGDWTYSFTLASDASGFITFDTQVVDSGDVFGIGGWGIRWRQQGVFGQGFDFLTNNILVDEHIDSALAQGHVVVPLARGGTYTFWLENESGLGAGSGIINRVASTSGHIDWQITEVPEPSVWAMMILGFGAVGGRGRRRRSAAANP